MTTRSAFSVLFVAVLGASSSCGYDTPASPSGSVTGAWTGVASETGAGPGTARLVLQQNGSSVNGTLTTTFGGVVTRQGMVSGGVNGTTLTLGYVSPAPLVCGPDVTLSGTVAFTLATSPSRLTGTYSGITCGGALTGSIEVNGP